MSRRGRFGRALHQFIEALENRRLLAAGQLDPSFSGDGMQTVDFNGAVVDAFAVAVTGVGKTIIVGHAEDPNTQDHSDVAVVRLNFDGSPDTSFGPAHTGIVRLHPVGDSNTFNGLYAVAIQGDGRILAAGRGDNEMLVMRFQSNGTLDRTFSGDGIAHFNFSVTHNSEVHAIAIQRDGKIVVVGDDISFGADVSFGVARLNTDGTLDKSFDGDGLKTIDFPNGDDSEARAVTLDYTGTSATNPFFGGIVVSGDTYNDNNSHFAVARIKPNGVLDGNFKGGGLATYSPPNLPLAFSTGVVVQSSGKIVLSGAVGPSTTFPSAGEVFGMTRLTSKGGVDPTFAGAGKGWAMASSGGGSNEARSIIVGQNNRLILGGTAGNKLAFASFTADGILDNTLFPNGKMTVDIPGISGFVGVDFNVGMAYGPGNRFEAAGGGKFGSVRILDTGAREVATTAILTTASEQGPTPVTFLVTRSERLPVTTRVFFTIGGTASSPNIFSLRNHTNDYTVSGMTIPIAAVIGGSTTPFVDIAPNQTVTMVTLTPVDDDIIEGKETATFTIKSDASYDLSTPTSANLTINDNDGTSTVILNATADAYVRDGASAAMNFGKTADLQVKKGGSGFNRFSYLKFDISGATSITGATLEAFGKLSSTADPSVITNAFSVADTSWTETGITFNNAPAAGPNPLSNATITGVGGDIFTWDVTNYVKAEKAAGHNIVSFVLKNPNTSTSLVQFNSREAGSQTPSLVLDAKPVGTFKVSTMPSTVAVGQSTNVALTWTVPSGSWRQLSDIEMRLRGDDGSLVIIDWNETANTLAMFNPATGKFGAPMPMGGDNVISNNVVDMVLKTSSTKASGPTSPTVTVTFDLRFNHSAAGHTYTIEAAASNDSGAQTKFGLGGSIHVM